MKLIDVTGGPFGALYADPPWPFKTYSKPSQVPQRAQGQHYATMTMEALHALPVGDLAAKDAALFMWASDSLLPQAIELGQSWGFTYKTIAFIWAKRALREHGEQFSFFPADPVYRMGLGYWVRKQGEICLLFTRGKPKRLAKDVRQIIVDPRREHSRKPAETYDRIEALVNGPYLELFARQVRPAWTSWGNEVDKYDAYQT